MKIFRSVLSGLAAFVCISSVVGLVYLLTLQATIFDRSAVKGWLTESKIYEGALLSSIVQPTDNSSSQDASAFTTSPAMLTTALNATFTPGYMREQVELVLDSAYDWIEGDKAEFSFSIPIDQKRDTFIQQLSRVIEPQVTALPICGTTQNAMCRPNVITPEQFAVQMTTQSVDESGMFAAPITPATFSQASPQPDTLALSQLPALRKTADLLFIILPVAIILSALAAVFIMQPERRIPTSIKLSRRIFFSTLLTAITALIIIFILSNNYYDLSKILGTPTGAAFAPLLTTIIIDIAVNLSIYSGIFSSVAAGAWIVLRYFQRKNAALPPSYAPPTVNRY